MKTLKKVLSLVLVVAMIASMLIVGAAAAEEETQYDEAVAVVKGLGIIEGDETGMNFTGKVTREQAAKMIAYLLLGEKTAEALKTSAAPFADVAATRWSAGYIAYLKGQGIISGVSDTEFDPTANVTGVAFAKMLLTAIGYGQAGEFEGAAWDINTITFANQTNLYEGSLAATPADAATREEAMLYLFNALQVPTVNYNKTFESYYTGASALAPVVDDPATPADETYPYTLGWKNYTLEKSTTGETNDIFGRPCASWVVDTNVIIAENVANAAPDHIAIGSIDSAVIYDVFGKTVVEELNADKSDIVIYNDGTATTGSAWANIAKGEHTNAVYAATVELYLGYDGAGDYNLTIVAVNDHVGTVQRVNTAKNFIVVEEVLATYDASHNITGSTIVSHTFDGEEIDITGINKFDVVTFTYGSDRAVSPANVYDSIAVAKGVNGLYTGTASSGMFKVVDGAYYMTATSADYTAQTMAFDNVYTLYFDRNGSILKADLFAGNASFDYLYVTGAEAQAYDGSVLNGGDAKVALKVVYPEGGSTVLYAAVNFSYTGFYYYITVEGVDYVVGDNELYQVAADGSVSATPSTLTDVLCGWKSHTVNEAGAVTLKAISPFFAATTDAITVTTNLGTDITAGALTYSANSKTVLTKVDAYGTVVSYTGVKNFPSETMGATDTVLYTYDLGSTSIKNIVVFTPAPISTTLNLAYCAENLGTATAGTTYLFYIDGTSLVATIDASLSTGCVYNLTNTFGVYTATPAAAIPGITMVNEGSTVNYGEYTSVAPAAYGQYYAYMNLITYATNYFEWATVASVDENWFYTVGVANDADSIDASVAKQYVGVDKYFYDANTVIYDCTNGGVVVDGINAGDVFMAATSATASTTYADANYCTIIWIVG